MASQQGARLADGTSRRELQELKEGAAGFLLWRRDGDLIGVDGKGGARRRDGRLAGLAAQHGTAPGTQNEMKRSEQIRYGRRKLVHIGPASTHRAGNMIRTPSLAAAACASRISGAVPLVAISSGFFPSCNWCEIS